MDLADVESTRNYRWQTARSKTVVFHEALVRDSVTRFPENNVFGMNPGVIKTNVMAGALGQAFFGLRVQQTLVGSLVQSAETYAEKVVPLVVHPAMQDRSGSLFNRHAQLIEPNPWLVADDHCTRGAEAAEALSPRVVGQAR